MKREILLEHASTIQDEPMEHGIVLDRDGEVCTRLSGGRSSIVFDHRTLHAVCHRVFMHNHPRGGAFSTADIWTACALCMRGMVVVTHGCVHCLAPPGGRDFFCRDDYADIVRCYRFRCLTADLSKRLRPPDRVWKAVAADMDLGYCAIPFQKE
ncbi:hypothetical protein E2N92_05630 [Methanofollis formosanus]|uniref:Uncharacterized protein n=1 Tax=Methanofollis formosanus TaxID=299308 RepID=A0A8G1A1R2_9EURY|nr:hypothetical protein [Methanofollis formosanus]QYZ78940.1 hypothetical protein E2N92_05630 [Methanofollis formosanus]